MNKVKKILTLTLVSLLSFNLYSLSATVKELDGNATKTSQNSNKCKKLTVGSKIYKGDTVQLGLKSYAIIELSNEITFQLSSISRIVIEQLTEDKKNTDVELFLDLGSLKANVGSNDKSNYLRITSTTTAVSSREAEFLITSRGELYVFEGTVFKSKSKTDKPIIKTNDYPIIQEDKIGFNITAGHYSLEGFYPSQLPRDFNNLVPLSNNEIKKEFLEEPLLRFERIRPDAFGNESSNQKIPISRGNRRIDIAILSKPKKYTI